MKEGVRNSIIAKLVDKSESDYQGGTKKKVLFDFEDNSGGIQAIAWNDDYEKFNNALQVGSTYRLNSMLIVKNDYQNGRKELKIFNDSDIQKHADIALTHSYGKIENITEGEVCHVRGILAKSEETRCNVIDMSGEVTAFLRPNTKDVLSSLTTGDIVTIDGRVSSKTTDTVFVHTIQKSDDAALTAYWNEKQISYVPKRQKVDLVSINKLMDCKNLLQGARTEVRAVVQGFSVSPVDHKDGRVKHKMTIVDDSNVSITVAIFCDKAVVIDLNSGDVVSFEGAVSSWDGLSLTTNAVQKIDDAALSEWWNATPVDFVFEELSK